MVFVSKNKVIFGSEVRLSRQNTVSPIDFLVRLVFVGKNEVILGSEVRLVRQNKGILIDFSLKNGFCR